MASSSGPAPGAIAIDIGSPPGETNSSLPAMRAVVGRCRQSSAAVRALKVTLHSPNVTEDRLRLGICGLSIAAYQGRALIAGIMWRPPAHLSPEASRFREPRPGTCPQGRTSAGTIQGSEA